MRSVTSIGSTSPRDSVSIASAQAATAAASSTSGALRNELWYSMSSLNVVVDPSAPEE
jgi:hypothetical protein